MRTGPAQWSGGALRPRGDGGDLSDPERERRPYDSPLRRQRAAETRERIVAAGAGLLHRSPIWNWHALTVRAVAEQAGVNMRTVYRHFATEQDMRDAIMNRLKEEAGIDLDGLRLADFADLTARMFEYVSSFPIAERTLRDPTMTEANQYQRDSLLRAVTAATTSWPDADRAVAAALFDVLWSTTSYERMVTDWKLQPKEAIRGLTWVIRLVEGAIREGRRPPV